MNNKFKNYRVLTMEEFILNYLELNGDYSIFDKINHYDITDLNIDGVKRVPDQLVTEEDLRTGRVLLVQSKGYKHRGKMVCAYLRPDIVKLEENQNEVSDLDKMLIDALYKSDTKLFRNKSLKKQKVHY